MFRLFAGFLHAAIWTVVVALPLLSVSGLLTHAFVCARDGQWILLAFGWLLFPIGIVHGWAVWVCWLLW